MIPVGKLAPQAWMTAPETRSVVEALTAQGAEIRFVGGCVRDALSGRPVKDIDLATVDPPDKVVELLANAGLKAVPTGIDHGTVTAVANHKPFEVTTLRHDVETHGRHATVAFTDDWKSDAARRDFTFNALSCRPDGTLFDPFGGRADLQSGRVRFVGDARARIEEDYLRLLRFFRFHAHYGRGEPDREGLAAAADLAPELARLSGERVRDEILRLLQAEDPIAVLGVMNRHRILECVLPELKRCDVLEALLALDAEASPPDRLLRLGALLGGGAPDAARVSARLRLSRAESERLAAMGAGSGLSASDLEPRALRRVLYRLGARSVADRLRLGWARSRAANQAVDESAMRQAIAAADTWQAPEFPLKGRDALALGVSPGAPVGRLLAQVEAWWQSEDFQPSREDCLARLSDAVAEQR